jgi:hypothetical protein
VVVDRLHRGGEICRLGYNKLKPAIGKTLFVAWQSGYLDYTAMHWIMSRLCPVSVLDQANAIAYKIGCKIRGAGLGDIVEYVREYDVVDAATAIAWADHWKYMPDFAPSRGMYAVWGMIFPWPPPIRGVWQIITRECDEKPRTVGDTITEAIANAIADGRIKYPHMIESVLRLSDATYYTPDDDRW